MGERRVTADGRILEMGPDGVPIVVGTIGGGAIGGGGIAPNPLKVQQARGDIAGQQIATQGKALDNQVTQATLPAVIAKAQADAIKAQADAATARANAAAQPTPESTKARADLGLDEVLKALANAKSNVSGWSAGLPGQFLQGWGGTQARDLSGDLSTIGSALTVDKLKEMKAQSSTGASGMGALSEKEGALLRDSVASLDQFQSPEKVKQSLEAIELHYRRLRAIQDGQNPDDPNVQKAYGIGGAGDNPLFPNAGSGGGGSANSGSGGPGGNPMTIASGATRREHSEALSAQIDAMMNAGASIDQINEVMRSNNYPVIDPASYAAARQWMSKNPGKRYTGGTADREVPLSMLERAAGSDTGAFLANMANDFTAGSVGALAGERGRGALEAMRQVSPNASAIGSVLGGIGGAMGTELAAARFLPGAIAARTGDVAYGGLQGFNTAQPGDGLKGALIGGAVGGVGGALGEKAGRYLGGALAGVTDPAIQRLRAAGVPMTAGQALSQSGTLGRTFKGVEDAMTSIPLVGNAIDARRLEGLQAFNEAAFRQAGEPIGFAPTATGQVGIDQLNTAKSQAYTNALGGRGIDVTDPAFVNDMGAVNAAARAIPNVEDAQNAALQAIQSRIAGAIDPNSGTIPGRGFQEAYRGLARTGKERANRDYGYEIGQVMRQGQDALAGALERQNPGAFQQFVAANQANRRLATLADAVNSATNQEAKLFTPAQLERADANSTTRLTSRINAMTGNRPFAQLAQDGQAILPSKLPDSGTFKRAIIGGSLTGILGGGGAAVGQQQGNLEAGAGIGSGVGLLAALALAGGGNRKVQGAITKAILDRPAAMRGIGVGIKNNAALGAPIGTGLLGSLLLPSMVGQ